MPLFVFSKPFPLVYLDRALLTVTNVWEVDRSTDIPKEFFSDHPNGNESL